VSERVVARDVWILIMRDYARREDALIEEFCRRRAELLDAGGDTMDTDLQALKTELAAGADRLLAELDRAFLLAEGHAERESHGERRAS